ncbi:asparagine synthase [Thalassospira povalilytica]|uniref:asparagine synthase n=1 Tax=Thalassospira povalilytica TaxID=732237 RepID=UPI001D185AAE|nr:asparagine synthase [Thalassospira povalilytica]MCC4242082.1 asparagine synthase [Thalassospira povalilytica]
MSQSSGNAVDGMYAMALLDSATESIELWRDPFGIKPMWSRKLSCGIAVASTIQSLLDGFGPSTPRYDGIQQFLAFGRPIDGGSFYEDIFSISRGKRLRLQQGACIAEQQIDLCSLEGNLDTENPQVLRQALQESIRRILPSNRTMGLAVSGGLDSTILAHQMAYLGVEDLQTVSVLIEGVNDGIDDLLKLKIPGQAARSWTHSSTTVTSNIFSRGFEQAVQDLGEPTRLSSVPLYGALADIAKDAGVVVLEVGEGADELFMGYSSYRSLDTTCDDFHFNFMLPKHRWKYLEALYGSGIIAHCRGVHLKAYPLRKDISGLEYLRHTELDHSLEPLLRRSDQILMSRSIEGRTPFLHGFVPQLAMSIKATAHMAGNQSKPMLRAAFPELNVLDGPWKAKTPFRAPVSVWLQTSLSPWMDRVLDDGTPLLRDLGLHERGLSLVRREALEGKEEALDMALALMSLVFWCDWLIKEKYM